jgi:hypothetical protein
MRYLLLLHASEAEFTKLSPAEAAKAVEPYTAYTNELKKAGALVAAARLRPTTQTSTIRVRNAQSLVTDGPFTEAKEALGGFYLIQAADQQEALTWAAKCPGAHYGVIEVRPIWE